jgi:hypothetical protein
MIGAAVPLCAPAESDHRAAHAIAASFNVVLLATGLYHRETNAPIDRITPPHLHHSKNATDCCVTKCAVTVSNCTHETSASFARLQIYSFDRFRSVGRQPRAFTTVQRMLTLQALASRTAKPL